MRPAAPDSLAPAAAVAAAAPAQAQRLIAAQQHAQAQVLLLAALAEPANRPEAHYLLAASALMSGRTAEGLAQARDALAADPHDARFHAVLGRAHKAAGALPAAVAAYRRAEGIDILIDLVGHTASERLRLLALTPAPVQVAYLGYPTWSGVPGIAHRITDATIDAGDMPDIGSERPLRLAGSMQARAHWRLQARQTLRASALLDERTFVRSFEAALQQAWDLHQPAPG